MKLARITEGRTLLFVPRASIEEAVPPTSPVFFNPLASANRDVSVALTEATAGTSFCDALAGVGARGVRIANEVTRGVHATLADFNGESLKVARRNARANRVLGRCKFVDGETNSFLHSRFRRDEKFDYVDVDPFGTPAPYLQGMLASAADGGVVSATATDTAVLCGVYPEVSRRRYGATPLNNSFHHETGIRILLNAIRRQAAVQDKGITPLAAHSTRHYMRVYARVDEGARRADEGAVNEGYVSVCESCGEAASGREIGRVCTECGGRVRIAGPLWTGKLVDEELVRRANVVAEKMELREASKVLRSVGGVDAFPPWSYRVDDVCSALKVATVADSRVVAILGESGFRCGRQPFEKSGLKTTAKRRDVVEAVRAAAGQAPATPRSSSRARN